MHPYLRSRLDAILTQLVAAHDGGGGLSTATLGSEREAFVDLLLRGCLPDSYRFGSGDVTDAHGNRSGQIDLVIEHPFFPSFPLLGTSQQRLYLIESVAMAIEVKSSNKQFEDAMKTMKLFHALLPDADWTAPGVAEAPRPLGEMRWNVTGRSARTSFPTRAAGFALVMYRGWENANTLAKHCEENELDVALQLSPAIFYARTYRHYGDEIAGTPKTVLGSAALAAFLFVVSEELRALSHYESNCFRRYLEREPALPPPP